MYQSTIFGTSVRPLGATKCRSFHTRPVTSWNGRGGNLLTRPGDADDDADPPPAVATFERLPHGPDIADALEAIIGRRFGQVNEVGDEITLDFSRLTK